MFLLLSSLALAAPLEREVLVPAAGLELHGTLALPPDTSGPVPGVVLVHGSGPNSRDAVLPGQLNVGFLKKIAVFEELSDALVDQGYAVLRYDKRSCGPFNGCADNGYPLPADDITIDVFVDDARSALGWLGQQAEVDGQRLVVVGHSQGATFVPQLLTEVPGTVAGVMLAGNYRPIDQVINQQVLDSRALFEQLGVPDKAGEKALAPLDEMVTGLAALRAGKPLSEQIGGVPVGFWQSWLIQADGVPAQAQALDKPMLVLSGSMDTNVPPGETELWRDALSSPPHEVVVLDCVSHALNCLAEEDLGKLKVRHIGKHVDARVPAEIGEFLERVLGG